MAKLYDSTAHGMSNLDTLYMKMVEYSPAYLEIKTIPTIVL